MAFSNFGDLKTIGEVLQQAGQADMVQKLLDVTTQAADMAEENARLKDELRRLKNELELQSKVKFEEKIGYLRIDDSGEKVDGPFCPPCYDRDSKLCRIHDYGDPVKMKCMVCSAVYPQG